MGGLHQRGWRPGRLCELKPRDGDDEKEPALAASKQRAFYGLVQPQHGLRKEKPYHIWETERTGQRTRTVWAQGGRGEIKLRTQAGTRSWGGSRRLQSKQNWLLVRWKASGVPRGEHTQELLCALIVWGTLRPPLTMHWQASMKALCSIVLCSIADFC